MNRFFVAALVLAVAIVALTDASPDPVRRRGPSRSAAALPYICDLEVGKGTAVGGDPIWIHSTRDTCMVACQKMKRRYARRGKKIIGVTTMVGKAPFIPADRESKCHCLLERNGGFTVDASQTAWKTCMFQEPGKPKVPMKYVVTAPVCTGLGSAFVRKGCFSFAKRGRYLVNRRYEIEWAKAKHSKFACDFVQECAKAARAANVMFFATHYWGECWEVQIGEGTSVPSGEGCSLADGLYKNQCAGTDLSHECLGSTNYYVYSIAVPRG